MARRRSVKTHTAMLARADNPITAEYMPRPPARHPLTEAQLMRVGDAALQNLIVGMGVEGIDKRASTRYISTVPYSKTELENMWRNSWLAGRVVDAPADDMTREWVKCTWDDYDKDEQNTQLLETAEEDFDMPNVANEALTWSRLYGGGAIIPLIDGDDDLSKPLDISLIRQGSLQKFHVLDRWRISPQGIFDNDRNSKNFGQAMFYQLADAGQTAPPVHWTRVIIFNGRRLPYWLWRNNNMWGDSVLQNVMDDITDYDAMRTSIGSMMYEGQVDVINSKNAADLMTTDKGQEKVKQRWALAKLMKSMNRMLILDAEDKFTQKTNTWTGLDHIWDKSIINVCGAAHIPITILFGQSPAGFSTGDADVRSYYDRIKKDQARQLRPPLRTMYKILCMSTFGEVPKNFNFKFNPLWQISGVEQATIDNTNATRDVALVNAGIISPNLAARELKDRGTFRSMEDSDVELADELMAQPVDDPLDPAARSAGRPKPGSAGEPGAGKAKKKKKTAPPPKG